MNQDCNVVPERSLTRSPGLILTLALALLPSAFLAGTPDVSAQAPAQPTSGQQVVLVTGSTSGLGREVALRLGAMGLSLIHI